MKKRILSLMLVLVFALLALPFNGVFADDPVKTERVGDFAVPWNSTAYQLEAIDGGFKFIPYGTSTSVAGATAYYDYKLYEGKFSFKINTSALANENQVGFVFGSSTFGGAGRYRAYFQGTYFNIYGYDANNNAQTIGNYKRQVNLNTAVPGWNSGDTVKVTFAFSQAGAVRLWINDTLAYSIDVDDKEGTYEKKCVPFGGNLSIFNGSQNVELKVTDFKIEGGLDFEVFNGAATYDAKNYKFNVTAASTFGYITNRIVRNGKVVIISRSMGGKNGCGPVVGVTHTNLDDKREGNGLSYYVIDANANRFCIWSGHESGHVDKMTTTSTTALQSNNGKWIFGSNLGEAITTANFNLASTSNTFVLAGASKNITVTDSAPFAGGYYGIRMDAADSNISYYVVNNEKEAIGIDIDAGNLNLSALETGKQYSVKVKTFPEGSVINSGDKIKLGGAGIEQVGNAVLNNDGSYTVKFMATSANANKLTASVDNHIFGTLSASVAVAATGDDVATGDATFIIGAGAVLVALLGTGIVLSKKRSIA